jgi:hypothetical protein
MAATNLVSDLTHETFLKAVRELSVLRLNADDARRLLAAKLTYGSGQPGLRGTCFYAAWQQEASLDFIEICAAGEESFVQLIGTTLHELGHCLAGPLAGHGSRWKRAARSLGLRRTLASGQQYHPLDFDNHFWSEVQTIPPPQDGRPNFEPAFPQAATRSCPGGRGARGGTSRGTGSGSRLRLYVCACPVRVRVASDIFNARCLRCEQVFTRRNH